MKWRVGITTCPRQNGGYLQQTLDSVYAGWDENEVYVSNDEDFTRGPWGNLLCAMHRAAERDPDIALFAQDDVLLSKNLREYLDLVLAEQPWWGKCGLVSLYLNEGTAKRYHHQGFHPKPESQLAMGACAFLMPRKALQLFIETVYDYPWSKSFHLAEIWLQSWCLGQKMQWIDHFPSFAKHIGKVSAIKKVPNEDRPRPEPVWTEFRHEGEWVEDAAIYFNKIDALKHHPLCIGGERGPCNCEQLKKNPAKTKPEKLVNKTLF